MVSHTTGQQAMSPQCPRWALWMLPLTASTENGKGVQMIEWQVITTRASVDVKTQPLGFYQIPRAPGSVFLLTYTVVYFS